VGLEVLITVALQFAFELVFQIIVWLPWDVLLWWGYERPTKQELREPPDWPIPLGGALWGAMLGGLSLVIMPRTVLAVAWVRVGNLVIAPLVCGALAIAIARRRKTPSLPPKIGLHFWFAFAFTMLFVATRFAWAKRPA
jgi:hypothetical protein